MSFWADVMLRQSHFSPAQKPQGLRVVCSKKISMATFFLFWVTQLSDSFLSYLPMKRIWRNRAVCTRPFYSALHGVENFHLLKKNIMQFYQYYMVTQIWWNFKISSWNYLVGAKQVRRYLSYFCVLLRIYEYYKYNMIYIL